MMASVTQAAAAEKLPSEGLHQDDVAGIAEHDRGHPDQRVAEEPDRLRPGAAREFGDINSGGDAEWDSEDQRSHGDAPPFPRSR